MASLPSLLRFSTLCRAHAAINLLTGGAILANLDDAAAMVHGKEKGAKLLGSTPDDRLAIRTSESLVGVLLVDVALLLGLAATAKDEGFRRDFCKVALAIHGSLAAWRFAFASKVPALEGDWQKQVLGDAVMACSWVYYLLQKEPPV
ncbi:hypothetical protein DFJ74DRAFT_678698 [Hyaloraphidium curvatum]|nr:hypothetical protein DFJ74DRAFT_678698 [Hyaloraphidium curvatum]